MLESAGVGANPHVFSILSPHSVPAISAFHKQNGLRGATAIRPGAIVRDAGGYYARVPLLNGRSLDPLA